MTTNFTPARSAFSRVFLIEGRARPDHEPGYKSCLRAGAPDQAFGDVERIECPDPDAYGLFVEIGEVKGAIERATLDLMGRYAADLESDLLRLARARCSADVQIHFGECSDPSSFNTFSKALILENAYLTNWSADELGALGSDENAVVNETAPISATGMYEVLQLTFAERGGDTVVNPLEDVVICSTPSCGECQDEDSGCDFIVAVSQSTTGSPGTGPEIVYSTDKGATWSSDEIDAMSTGETTSGVACVGDYVVVISDSNDALYYKLKSTIKAGTGGGWTEVTTGFVAAGSPNDIWSVGNYAFVVGDGGYVYGTADPTAGVTVLDAGEATTQDLNKVHAIDKYFAVAVGDSDAVIYTENQSTWTDLTATGSGHNLSAVWIKSENDFLVGTGSGSLYYTLDKGTTWTEKTNLPGTYTDINDIAFSTDSVGYLTGVISGPRARILRTFDGGYSWTVLPEGVGTMPLADAFEAIAACEDDPNFVVGVGLADDASDGILVVGQD